MPSEQIVYEHVAINAEGVPYLADTTMKVKELAAEKLSYGWSAEELKLNHPYLTLGQVYSALAYYADHVETIDRQIEDDARFADRVREAQGPSSFVAGLKFLPL